ELEATHGVDEAARLFAEHGRQAFLPLRILEKIIDTLQPDAVVATNSPRAEQAAILTAHQRGLPTLVIDDLFGLRPMYPFPADIVCAFSEKAKENLIAKGV